MKPGHYIVARAGSVGEQVPYWQPRLDARDDLSFDEAKGEVRRLFVDSVRKRLVADVPVGAYLSGGLDSSLVCATMAALCAEAGRSFAAFNVGFSDPRFDESDLARRIAGHFGATFETIPCGMADMAEEFEKTLCHTEMALVNPSAIAKQMLSRLVRSRGYKVCITGEGADEIFGGYPYFKQEAIWRKLIAPEERDEGKRLWERFIREEKHTEGALWHRARNWQTGDYWFGYPSFHQMRLENSSRNVARVLTGEAIAAASFPTPAEIFLGEHPRDRMRALDPFNARGLLQPLDRPANPDALGGVTPRLGPLEEDRHPRGTDHGDAVPARALCRAADRIGSFVRDGRSHAWRATGSFGAAVVGGQLVLF